MRSRRSTKFRKAIAFRNLVDRRDRINSDRDCLNYDRDQAEKSDDPFKLKTKISPSVENFLRKCATSSTLDENFDHALSRGEKTMTFQVENFHRVVKFLSRLKLS